MPPILVGVATQNNLYAYHWRHSAYLKGWSQPTLLGQGQPWRGFAGYCRWLLEWLETIPDTQLVLIADVYDALIQGTPAEAEVLYQKHPGKIIIGGENFCPKNSASCYAKNAKICKTDGWHVQSGSILAKVSDLRSMYLWIMENHNPNSEQYCIGQYMSQYCDKFHIDKIGELVANWYRFSENTTQRLRWDDGQHKFVTQANNVTPIVVHTPGTYGDWNGRSNYIRSKLIPGYTPCESILYECFKYHARFVPDIYRNAKVLFYVFISILVFIILGIAFGIGRLSKRRPSLK